jgi:hypothetical protein
MPSQHWPTKFNWEFCQCWTPRARVRVRAGRALASQRRRSSRRTCRRPCSLMASTSNTSTLKASPAPERPAALPPPVQPAAAAARATVAACTNCRRRRAALARAQRAPSFVTTQTSMPPLMTGMPSAVPSSFLVPLPAVGTHQHSAAATGTTRPLARRAGQLLRSMPQQRRRCGVLCGALRLRATASAPLVSPASGLMPTSAASSRGSGRAPLLPQPMCWCRQGSLLRRRKQQRGTCPAEHERDRPVLRARSCTNGLRARAQAAAGCTRSS